MAGLPGTGLGGLFYMLLVIWIIVRESWLSARGMARRERWTRIAGFVTMAAGIIAVMVLQAWLMQRWFGYSLYGEGEAIGGIAIVALVPLVLLMTLLTAAHVLRWAMRANRITRTGVPVALEQPPERRAA